jgi:hypothetical protein
MLILLWFVNFIISCLNAWGCGKAWTESKADGGFPHLLNWCGAIMSAVGFTWCYMMILGPMAAAIPFEHEVNGKVINAPYLDQESLQAFYQLGYLTIIVPLLGSGFVITANSWAYFWRQRTFGSALELGWNSYAMFHNVYSASTGLPDAYDGVSKFFGGDDSDSKSWVWILVLIALLAGCFTTYIILTTTQKSTALNRSLVYGKL